jgi:PAS domain S-box-containing protein
MERSLITATGKEQAIARLAARSERERRLYEAILTNTPDLAYVFDLNHRFIYANDGLLKMWGKSWDEAIGKNCLELGYEPWHAAMHDREIEQVIATKQPVRGEVPFTGTFGRRIYDYIFVPVIGPDGEVEAVAGTTRDVTERKQTIDDLNAAKNGLAAQLADMKRLHEFNQLTLEQDDLNVILRELLVQVAGLMQAVKGSVQLRERSQGLLLLVATLGFDGDFEHSFKFVEAGGFTICAAALDRRQRVLVEDLTADTNFVRFAEIAEPYGIRGAQSTPLLDRSGSVIAMLTTYSERPCRPSYRELQLMDLYLEVVARQIERKRHEEHREMLLNELNHRVKNTLVTVQSFAVQSLRNAGSAAQAREALEGRLVSLARAHDVLTREHWELANVTDVVASALSPYFAKIPNHQLHISGPKLLLKPKAALAFALVLHELATNAVKYGALLNESGKISVDWQVTSTEPQQVVFRWKERGGPGVKPPERRGFGSRLIEEGIKQDMAGCVQLDFQPAGLACEIQVPLDRCQ